MAQSQNHFRSISLPSRLHPINSNFETHLQNLKSWHVSHVSKAVPLNSDVIQSGLLELSELYNSVQDLAHSSATKQSLHQDGKAIEDSLSTSLELLDSCNAIKESVQMIRETIQALQSALRRKGLGSSIQADIASYFTIRKKMNKNIAKSLKTLKKLENKTEPNEDKYFIWALRQVSGITVAILKGILMLLSWPTSLNLVSKLMLTKTGKDHGVVSEIGCVDIAVNSLHGRVKNTDPSKSFGVQMMQRRLQNADVCAEAIETGLERLFRELVRTRVTLLNIVTDH